MYCGAGHSRCRLVLGAGVGWARQEFDALGVPFNGDHRETAHPETAHPETAWRALATVAELWDRQESQDIDPERS